MTPELTFEQRLALQALRFQQVPGFSLWDVTDEQIKRAFADSGERDDG
jgi:hypothetical protein